MEKIFFIIYNEELIPGQTENILCVVTKKDYDDGYNASYENNDTQLLYLLDEIGCAELQEGCFEITGDVESVRKELINYGLEERTLH